MPNIYRIKALIAFTTLAVSCAAPMMGAPTLSPLPEGKIIRHPKPMSGRREALTSIPKFDSNSDDSLQVDLRSRDLTKIDMTDSLADLMYADFDNKTQWPSANKMPAAFDWQKIMGLGKDPGLGVRALHSQGITGKGIGVAIIDQTLLVDHIEYKNRLQLYEEINISPDASASTHGAAVASIAVGRTVGIAPEADLYYIAAPTEDWNPETEKSAWNFKYYAQAVRRILEINQGLPDDRKIRVITMQINWGPSAPGYDEITAAVNEAKAAGIFVISSGLRSTDRLTFQGLGRNPLDDPNRFESYSPGLWWEKDFFAGRPSERYKGLPADFYSRDSMRHILLIPMDSRTTASPTGIEDYVFYREGGWSWSIPYLAGMYALAVQVKPDITPQEFWKTALKTGRTIQLQHDGKDYEFGIILDPQALIEAIKNK